MATFSSNTLISHDIKDLIACLLSSSAYMLWDGTWKRSLRSIHSELLQSSAGTLDAFRNIVIADHLNGEGE